jgi:hypothetical protein
MHFVHVLDELATFTGLRNSINIAVRLLLEQMKDRKSNCDICILVRTISSVICHQTQPD